LCDFRDALRPAAGSVRFPRRAPPGCAISATPSTMAADVRAISATRSILALRRAYSCDPSATRSVKRLSPLQISVSVISIGMIILITAILISIRLVRAADARKG